MSPPYCLWFMKMRVLQNSIPTLSQHHSFSYPPYLHQSVCSQNSRRCMRRSTVFVSHRLTMLWLIFTASVAILRACGYSRKSMFLEQENTRMLDIYNCLYVKLQRAANHYCTAYGALLALDLEGLWRECLKELKPEDISRL